MRRFTLNTGLQEALIYPIAFYTASDYYEQENVKGRIMPFHQLLLVLDGEGTLRCGSKCYKLQKGCAFFTKSYTPVEYINENGLISAFLTIKGNAINSLAKKLTDEGLLFKENVNVEKYVSLIKKLLHDYRNGCDQGALSVQAYSIFVDFLSKQNPDIPDWLNATARYIVLNLDKKLTLSELASYSHVSVSKLCHDFKKHFSVSVFEYIMNIRLQHARALLLASPDIMTKDVSELCGFFDVGYFCRMYRKKYGKTPTDEKLSRDKL